MREVAVIQDTQESGYQRQLQFKYWIPKATRDKLVSLQKKRVFNKVR